MTEQSSTALGAPVPPNELIEDCKDCYAYYQMPHGTDHPPGQGFEFAYRAGVVWGADEQLKLSEEWLIDQGLSSYARRMHDALRSELPASDNTLDRQSLKGLLGDLAWFIGNSPLEGALEMQARALLAADQLGEA
jgi:hypothetical protein